MGIKINQNLTSVNHTVTSRGKAGIKYIVIHYVGALGGAYENTQFFKSVNRGASADFFVGHDGEIWQCNDYLNYYSWHCGGGRQTSHGGSFFGKCTNSNSIGIEMCVRKRSSNLGGMDKDWYFEAATEKATIELTKQLMKELNIPAENVIRHYDVNGKYCPNPYVDEINAGAWANFKKQLTSNDGETSGQNPAKLYRVRKSWSDSKSQLGAYASLKNAKLACPYGYYVFDYNGKKVYTPPAPDKKLQAKDLKGLKPADVIKAVGPLFTADQKKTGVLASVSLAQFALESGWGQSELVQNANNGFGMKKTLSGNTWPNSSWDGSSIYTKKTGEETANGEKYTITADFRKYDNLEQSIADHSAYLTGAKNGSELRYKGLKGEKNYSKAAKILKNGGYATSSSYVKELCGLIESYNLAKYDAIVTTGAEPASKPTPSGELYKVKVSSKNLRIRTGPGTNYGIVGYTGEGVFTIIEEKGDWGRLKSGKGWICTNISCVTKLK